MKTIVLSGGHMSPAVAVSEEMAKRKWNVVVFGRSHAFSEASSAMSLEKQMFEKLGVKFYDVSISRLPSSVFQAPRYIVSFITTTYSILSKLKTINPSVVLSFGGYVSVPLLVASFMSGIPILLHDQTIKAGRANKFFSYIAKKVFISWKETKKDFPSFIQHKIVLAGNPVRKEIIAIDKGKPDFKNIHLYITGGSTGSHAINEVVSECMRELCEKYTVVHQVGDSHYHDFEKLEDIWRKLPVQLQKKYTLLKYVTLSKIPSVLSSSDILVGRSGANTVSEVSLLGIPSIFVPLPNAQYNEQELLAQILADGKSAVIIQQDQLTKEILLDTIDQMVKQYSEYYQHAQRIRQSPEITLHKDAGRTIADSIESFGDNLRNSSH